MQKSGDMNSSPICNKSENRPTTIGSSSFDFSNASPSSAYCRWWDSFIKSLPLLHYSLLEVLSCYILVGSLISCQYSVLIIKARGLPLSFSLSYYLVTINGLNRAMKFIPRYGTEHVRLVDVNDWLPVSGNI